MALNTVRKVGASLLPRRADLFQGLRRQHTSSPPENNEELRKVLLNERYRVDLDRQVVRDGWEKLSFVRGTVSKKPRSALMAALISFGPKSLLEALNYVGYLIFGTVAFASSTPEKLEKAFKDRCDAWILKLRNIILPSPPSKE